MLAEIASRFLWKMNQRPAKHRPAEDVDPHRCQVASGLCRFLLELCNAVRLIRDDNAKTAGLFHRYRHGSDGNIRIVRLVIFQHYLIIHLVNMVTRKDQYIIRVIGLHKLQVLKDRIGGAGVPVTAHALFVRRKNRDSSHITV